MVDIRRVVAGLDTHGKSVFLSDGPAPHSHDFVAMPGQAQTKVWYSAGTPTSHAPDTEPTASDGPVVPGAGGASFVIVQYAPESVVHDPRFDPVGVGEELNAIAPDLAEAFEVGSPGVHRTPTVDYGIVIQGEVWLELDDGAKTLLRTGDTVVQIHTRHAWRNTGDVPAAIAFVLTGVAD
jgi:mannose-6-phosphate isomerase-like protein (cupin superfamily)